MKNIIHPNQLCAILPSDHKVLQHLPAAETLPEVIIEEDNSADVETTTKNKKHEMELVQVFIDNSKKTVKEKNWPLPIKTEQYKAMCNNQVWHIFNNQCA